MGLLQKGITSILGTFILQVVTTTTSMMVSRSLGPDGMGRYQLLLSAQILVVSLVTTGMGQATIYFLNNRKVPAREVVAAAGLFGAAAGTIGGIGLFIALHVESYFGEFPEWLLVLAATSSLLVALTNCLGPIQVAFLHVKRDVLQRTLPRVLVLALVAVAFWTGTLDVNRAITFDLVVHLLSLFLLFVWLRPHLSVHVPGTLRRVREMVGMGFKFGLANAIYVFNVNIALMLVKTYYPDDFTAVGLYGRAVTVASMLLLLPLSVGPLLYSRWAGLQPDDRIRESSRAVRLMAVLGIAACGFIIGFGRWILLVLFGEAFLDALSPMRILVVAVFFRFLLSPFIQLWSGSGRPMDSVWSMLVSLVVMVGSIFYTTPRWGLDGAAASVTLGNLAGLAFAFWRVRKVYGVRLGAFFRFEREDYRIFLRALAQGRKRPDSPPDGGLS